MTLDFNAPGLKKIPQPIGMLLGLTFAGFCLAAVIFSVVSHHSRPAVVAPVKEKVVLSLPLVSPAPSNILSSPAPSNVLSSPASVAVIPAKVSSDEQEIPSEGKAAAPFLTLSGILYGEKGSVVLINGKVVPEGGTIKGARVEKISRDRVELSYEGKTMILQSH